MLLNKSAVSLAVLAAILLGGCSDDDSELSLGTDTDTTTTDTTTDTGSDTDTSTDTSSSSITFSIASSASVTEPSDGSKSYAATVSMSDSHSSDITVDYSMTAVTAEAGDDFILGSGTITVPAGSSSFDVPYTVYGDNIDEDDEAFYITISNPSFGTVSSTASQSDIKIEDSSEDDSKLSFESASYTVAEDNGTYQLTVALSVPTERDVSVSFNVSGLATQGADYTVTTANPVALATGSNEVSIEFEFIDDGLPEGGESLVVALETPDNASLGDITETTIVILGDVGLNDTGVTSWYDGATFTSTATDSSYPGQDAEYGRDAASGNVASDGPAGFSFTKLDSSGNALPSSDSSFTCVKDNRTNLIWETKQSSQTLPTSEDDVPETFDDETDENPYNYDAANSSWRAVNYRYYWYNSDAATNGGSSGAQADGQLYSKDFLISPTCAYPYKSLGSTERYCNTEDYIAVMNSLSICGFTDWRLPTASEITSIQNYRATGAEAGEETYFSNVASGDYISATTSADGNGAAWCMDADKGQLKLCKKTLPFYVRAVRGGAE